MIKVTSPTLSAFRLPRPYSFEDFPGTSLLVLLPLAPRGQHLQVFVCLLFALFGCRARTLGWDFPGESRFHLGQGGI